MAEKIEDYALVSNKHSSALISREGAVEWLSFPRYDSPAVFASLLGNKHNGIWELAPAIIEGQTPPTVLERAYIHSTFVVHTRWQTDTGTVLVTDFMPIGKNKTTLIRRVKGISGCVSMHHKIKFRFGYGKVTPWVRKVETEINQDAPTGATNSKDYLLAMAGPDGLVLRGEHMPEPQNRAHRGHFDIEAGEETFFELTWFPSHEEVPAPTHLDQELDSTISHWTSWASSAREEGDYASIVKRSLLVLSALTHADTGGIVAAPTTSLPEEIGGERNWDYRFCWLRDASLALRAMLSHGYKDEAYRWKNWLLRSIAGDPEGVQIMYGVGGERNLSEHEISWLSGYENSKPVRIGNKAVYQYQADSIGEVMVALESLRELDPESHTGALSWSLQRALLGYQAINYKRKDHGLWEMRGEPRYFTESRVMMWAAFNAGVRAVREFGYSGPVEMWENFRDELREEILEKGFNKKLNSFTQTYESTRVDASLLILPQVGFLDYYDPKMLGTVKQVEKELLIDQGLLLRYKTEGSGDGLESTEHPFLACSFWLVEQYANSGRLPEAIKLMDQLVGYANELELLAEEYEAETNRQMGNYPQAFSHLTLIRAADAIEKNKS